ncbi:MAG: hypothetical protein KatS3mg108_1101 [Isosphaeraceae bacterium]|jgi:hypothetical protein|nr:MAG: hypothetical protein KatS3mg108_1101 [Isosphaeraceae bacterium]
MAAESNHQSARIAIRLVFLGAAVLLGLLALRFGPSLARHAGWTPPSGSPTPTGSFRPLQPLEDALAHWLAATLAEPPPRGEILSPQIRYQHPWPQGLFLLVALGGTALIVALYRREASAPPGARALLTSLRIGLLLLAMLFLAEAALTLDRFGLPTFVILIDDSASSQVEDAFADPATQARAAQLAQIAERPQADRLALALGRLLEDNAQLLRFLAERQRVRLYRVSDAAVQIAEIERPDQVDEILSRLKSLDTSGQHSRLGEAVAQVLRDLSGSPPTAILLFSDGQTTDGLRLTEAAELAHKQGVPLFTIGLGDETPPLDLSLSDLQVDDVVFVDDVIRFTARLSARGTQAGSPASSSATIRLLRRRPDGSLEPLESRSAAIPPEGEPARVEIAHRPTEVGASTFVLEVEPLPRERQRDNNQIDRVVEVRDQKLRVLYVEGEPRWEFRYLKTYLERDTTIDLRVLLQLSDDRYAEQDRSALPEFPPGNDSPDGLFSFDVLILGDVDPSLLNTRQMEDIVEFVTKKGGGLYLIAGMLNPLGFGGKPLEQLLPIRLEDARNPVVAGIPVEPFQLQPTPAGLASPLFRLGDDEAQSRQIRERLQPSLWYFEAPRIQPAAVVLAEHPTQPGANGKLPLIVTHNVGAGRVLFSAVDDTWRWRFRVGDRYFGRYWVQALRYLAAGRRAGSRQAEVVADRRRYLRGQPIRLSVRFLNPALVRDQNLVQAELRREGLPPRTLSLRLLPGSSESPTFETTLTDLPQGRYSLRLVPPPVLDGEPPSISFQVDPPAGEFVRLELNREELIAAARISQGHYFRWDETAKPVADLAQPSPRTEPASPPAAVVLDDDSGPPASSPPPLRSLNELLPAPQLVPLDADPPIPLWNSWPLFLTFLSLIAIEWIVRKRLRMT